MAISIVTCNLPCLHIKPRSRSEPFFLKPIYHSAISEHKDRCYPLGSLSFKYISTGHGAHTRDWPVCRSAESGSRFPFSQPENSWLSLLFGMLVSIPLVGQRLLELTRVTETAAETVENVAEVVEEVAEQVEKIAEEAAEKLPEGGILGSAITFVHNLADQTTKQADLVEALMDKVEEVDQKVESFVTEPFKGGNIIQ